MYHENDFSLHYWDVLVLTVRDNTQKTFFELQIAEIGLGKKKYFVELHLVADEPAGAKIGSGGATLNTLHFLHELHGESLFEKRVLILHSGGFCQRLPHVSAIGKAFMLMPNGQTLLETKLMAYRSLLSKLDETVFRFHKQGFVFIASSDVLESFDHWKIDEIPSSENPFGIWLIAHESPIEIAVDHGVYVKTKESGLKIVLQKPSLKLMQQENAIMANGLVLTDSCYLLADLELIKALIFLIKEQGPINCELCCYRDFLCPLGKNASYSYFSKDTKCELHRWQNIIQKKMTSVRASIINLGPNSFFHFGTSAEFLLHFTGNTSDVKIKFLRENQLSNIVHNQLEEPEQVPATSFIEWSIFGKNLSVGKRCIISGVDYNKSEKTVRILDEAIVLTLRVLTPHSSAVTAIFSIKDDLKEMKMKGETLCWFNRKIEVSKAPMSLWTVPLFPVCLSSNKSLRETLTLLSNGNDSSEKNNKKCVSMEWATKNLDVEKTLEWQRQFLSKTVKE